MGAPRGVGVAMGRLLLGLKNCFRWFFFPCYRLLGAFSGVFVPPPGENLKYAPPPGKITANAPMTALFCCSSLDKQQKGYLTREDFLRIPELAINPLGDRIVHAFFRDGKKQRLQLVFQNLLLL